MSQMAQRMNGTSTFELNRRQFLGFAAGTALLKAANAPVVIIAGGGLAGLCCAYELRKRGAEVVLLEGRSRPGGRVETLREGFAPGLTAETGATRIPGTHDLTLGYVREFGLPLEPFHPSGANDVFHLRGKNLTVQDGREPDWPLNLRPEERRLGRGGLTERYLLPPLTRSRGSELSPQVPEPIVAVDQASVHDYLAQQRLSEDAIELINLGGDTSISTALLLLVISNEQARRYFHIRGGNDQLPNAFAERIGGRIRYGCRVTAIGQDGTGAWAVVERDGARETIRGDHVVCALPFSMTRQMFGDAKLSTEKQRVIREQKYFPVDKVFLQMSDQYWRTQGLSGFAETDLLSERFWALGGARPEDRALLLSYVIGAKAAKLDQLDESARIEQTLADADRVFPGARSHFEGGRSKSWAQDPWQRGALAKFDPGEIGFIAINARPEGRIHFAGEHTSRWNGWMQGALESAHRVVQEIRS